MTTLYGWGPLFGCPSPSPFVMKSDIQLQMLGVAFDRAIADLESVSKHKAPYLEDDGQIIQDTNFIRAHLETKTGRMLDEGLAPAQKAASWALERLAEGHLRDVILCERWLVPENFEIGPKLFFMDAPEEMREQICAQVVDDLSKTLYGQGIGRHSREERLQLAAWDLGAIALQLGDKPFLFGDEPTVADAAVGAQVISAGTDYFNTPLSGLVHQHANLTDYIKRIEARYFSENNWPMPG